MLICLTICECVYCVVCVCVCVCVCACVHACVCMWVSVPVSMCAWVCGWVCISCNNIQSPAHRQPEPISSDILDNMKMVQFVGYAPKPAGMHRNQCPYQLSKYQSSNKKTEPESPMMRGML